MHLINLTQHSLTLVGENGTIAVPPSGQVARLDVTRTTCAPVTIDGVTIQVSQPTPGDIVGLPAPQPGVILIVSALVAEAAGHGKARLAREAAQKKQAQVLSDHDRALPELRARAEWEQKILAMSILEGLPFEIVSQFRARAKKSALWVASPEAWAAANQREADYGDSPWGKEQE